MTRNDKLTTMKGSDLIALAERLGVKVACNKARTQLKESKQAVIDRIIAKENEQEKPEVVHVEVTDLPAVVRVEQKDVEAEKEEAKQKKKERKSNTKEFANSFLENVPESLYKVDKKGRYNFGVFSLIFKKNEEITLAPTRKFKEAHDINWEYHEGWSNPYRTTVPVEFVKTAIIELM